MYQREVVLIIGSNLGNPLRNVENALEIIGQTLGEITDKTSAHTTKPVEFASSNYFCNIAVSIKTNFTPLQLLDKIKKIEADMGRIWDSARVGFYQDRIIDIDIVTYGALRYRCNRLTLPHGKHLYNREFSKSLIAELNLKQKS